MKMVNTLTRKWPTKGNSGRLKAVRMIREMRKIGGAMIPMMIGPSMRMVFSGAVQKGSPRRTLD